MSFFHAQTITTQKSCSKNITTEEYDGATH